MKCPHCPTATLVITERSGINGGLNGFVIARDVDCGRGDSSSNECGENCGKGEGERKQCCRK